MDRFVDNLKIDFLKLIYVILYFYIVNMFPFLSRNSLVLKACVLNKFIQIFPVFFCFFYSVSKV